MNPADRESWQFETIGHILRAMARSRELRANLVFKGAQVLNRLLGSPRVSLDIDTNLAAGYAGSHPDREGQKAFLEEHVARAVFRYFEAQEPVRYGLERLRIDSSPLDQHPRGWNAFVIKVALVDHKHVGVRGMPPVTIDVAAPELLSENSTADLDIDGATIKAYTLERIAGEKARAFLSTLPAYRTKMKRPTESVRVKDLYDLARIIKARPIADAKFWTIAGQEFRLACESRYVDCAGLESFKEGWAETRALFQASRVIPRDCTFEEVEATIVAMAGFWEKIRIIPFDFSLPSS